MSNKCPKCSYNFQEQDVFCSRCGTRLKPSSEVIIEEEIKKFETSKVSSKKNKPQHFNSNAKQFSDNASVSVGIILVSMFVVLGVLMFFILNKHDAQKDVLKYKNLMANPAQIPLLKNPSNYQDLANDLISIQDFMLLYLQNTSDSTEKKEQVFASFLSEISKLPQVLNLEINKDEISQCVNTKSYSACVSNLSRILKPAGVNVFQNKGVIYLYPDYQSIRKKYSNYISSDINKFLTLQEKYNYPVSFGIEMYIRPKELVNKIYDIERLFLSAQNQYIKDICEEILHNDVRRLLFTPSIYATKTQEMTKEFENAYLYFINSKKNSTLRPLIMSYFDKKRSYSEENFKTDYPYKKFEFSAFDADFNKVALDDVFVQLRKNVFINKNTELSLSYIYDIKTSKWKKYSQDIQLSSGEYVITEPDENNNVSIYNHMFSPMQELNIFKYSKLYLINGALYVYNRDKLSVYKVTFNGRTFNLYNLSFADISSLFPGVEVINMDTFSSYNVLIEKPNSKAAFIVMSRYSHGWSEYNLQPIKGEINMLTLPNLFSVDSEADVVVSFHGTQERTEEFVEQTPQYKFTIRTIGYNPPEEKNVKDYANYDEKTKKEEENSSSHMPNMMPKMFEKSESTELDEIDIQQAPKQELEPPSDINNDKD